jgi:hypothetical protein
VATGLDPKQKKIAIGVAAVGGAGYLYYRHRANAAAAAAAPADTSGTSAADTAALGLSSATGPGVYGAQGSAASSTTVGSVTTNQDWYAAALSGAEDAGYDAAAAGVALSAYLAHQPLTAAQQTIVRIGLAAAGNPPSGTFTIITAPGGSAPGTPAPPSAVTPAVPGNLRVVSLGTTSFTLGWNTSATPGGAYQYHVYEGAALAATVFGTFWASYNRKKATRYGPFTVRAAMRDGTLSAPSNPLYVTTKAK